VGRLQASALGHRGTTSESRKETGAKHDRRQKVPEVPRKGNIDTEGQKRGEKNGNGRQKPTQNHENPKKSETPNTKRGKGKFLGLQH